MFHQPLLSTTIPQILYVTVGERQATDDELVQLGSMLGFELQSASVYGYQGGATVDDPPNFGAIYPKQYYFTEYETQIYRPFAIEQCSNIVIVPKDDPYILGGPEFTLYEQQAIIGRFDDRGYQVRVYVGRLDTGEYSVTAENSGSMVFPTDSYSLDFTKDDVGKTVPLWISYNEPPNYTP